MRGAKFTQGPWHRNIKPASRYPTIWAGRNTHVAAVVAGAPHRSGNGCSMPEEELEANIDLITAAPEMHAALCEVVKWNAKRGEDDEILPADQQCDEIASAMRALARAEGRAA